MNKFVGKKSGEARAPHFPSPKLPEKFEAVAVGRHDEEVKKIEADARIRSRVLGERRRRQT